MDLLTATSAKKAYNLTRLFRIMFKNWYAKNECHDPKCLDAKLHDIRLINHATALDVVIRVFNRGFSPLSIHGAKIKLLIGGFQFESPYLAQNQKLEAECIDGRLVHFVIQSPYLTQERFLFDIRDSIESLSVEIGELELDIARGRNEATRIFDVNGHTDWKKSLKGIQHYNQV